MATMVKEKSRAKKKTKDKHTSKSVVHTEDPAVTELTESENEPVLNEASFKNAVEDGSEPSCSTQTQLRETDLSQIETTAQASDCPAIPNQLIPLPNEVLEQIVSKSVSMREELTEQSQGAYTDVCRRLDIVTFKDIPVEDVPIEVLESRLEASESFLNEAQRNPEIISVDNDKVESAIPSAPVFEEAQVMMEPVEAQEVLKEIRPKVQCMPLDMAIQLFGGKEMAEVWEMSEREEALVEAGALPGPEHPLVDLLSTFRCSLSAKELVTHKIAQGYAAADKERVGLWKVEKRTIVVSEQCHCEATVTFKGTYDHAELMKSKLPAAQLRLEGLLTEVQESACHYQHAALLAYYQIEELISETLQAGQGEIRAALALVLHELRVCGAAPAQLCGALRRWARALAAALLDARDPRQLLFLMHNLFRQSRSVRWAAPLLRAPMAGADAPRALALLARLLAGPALEAARECTEAEQKLVKNERLAENEEMWEELGHGGGGGVREGALRERDLLALLRAFPLRGLLARALRLPRADITQTRPHEWSLPAHEVLRGVRGVRAVCGVARRAARAHGGYGRLCAALAAFARAAANATAALHLHNRDSYPKEMEDQIEAELEALFVESCAGAEGPRPPAALLAGPARAAYCAALITHAHEPSVLVEPLGLELRPGGCARAVRDVTRAAAGSGAELARLVLDFLAQTALKRSKASCGGACADAARECLPRLLRAHGYLHTTALLIVADLQMLEPLGSSASLDFLALARWRPAPDELRAVLEAWARRPALPRLLRALRYTPHDGLSLETQLALGAWLCAAPAADWTWHVLARLRVHRSSWGLPLEAPPPEDTSTPLAEAYAVLSSSWGHSVPEICEYGVQALCRVAAARPAAAAHALPLVMAAMGSSPESVALTPQFTELAATLLAPASLVQWARGAPGEGSELLLRRVLAQVEAQPATAAAWLRALLAPALGGARLAPADAVLLAARRVPAFQEPPDSELLTHLVRNAAHAPLACDAALRAAHARELSAPLLAPLLAALAAQRAAGQRIHVDNALKQIGSAIGSEELVIYRAAAAALAAPREHPAHLALWSLLLQLYLHAAAPNTPPLGVAFFSGLIKSRTLAQLKKRLQETISYHHSQVDSFKTLLKTTPKPTVVGSHEGSKSRSPVTPTAVFPEWTDESESSESEELEDSDDGSKESDKEDDSASDAEETRRINVNMLKYHESAENMLCEYLSWLEAGDRLRAAPHHADIARFIPDPALSTAWSQQLARCRPAESLDDDDLRPPRAPDTPAPPTPLETAVCWLLRVPQCDQTRSRVPVITSPMGNVDFGNQRQLFALLDKHLNDLEQFSKEWSEAAARVSALDGALWPLVGALRARAPLAPVRRACANRCAPLVLPMQGCYEWRVSDAAANSIKDNRSRARAAVANLMRARPRGASTVASLHTIARRVRSSAAALGAAERAWRCAGAAPPCAPALDALAALVDQLADRWLRSDEAADLVSRWCAGATAAQQALCTALLARVAAPRPRLYAALLAALPGAPAARGFSYLSKFDMSCPPTDAAARGDMLGAVVAAALRAGSAPPPDALPLLELMGVHTAALLTAAQLAPAVLGAARAAAAARAPAPYLAHVARAAAAVAPGVPFDELGNILRELGAIWWDARARPRSDATGELYEQYAPHVFGLQQALLRAFVAAAVELSYAPERVGWYAWSAALESWGAWVSPHRLPRLARAAPATFAACLLQLVADCPGCEEHLLSQVFEWTVQMYVNVAGAGAGRVQLADLLEALGALPWAQCQWPRASSLPAALQISATSDEQMRSWVADTLRGVDAAAWLRGAGAGDVAPRLAALLRLAAGTLPLHTETLEALTTLPWARLPAPALEEALQRFFEEHHDPAMAYHDAPQFSVILAASGLQPYSPHARAGRAAAVSWWARAASAPPLRAHAAAHARAVLNVLETLEPHLDEASGELEELLQRAAAVLSVEPGAAAALPEWQRWASTAGARRAAALLAAARALPALAYFAPLADAAAAALLAAGGSWPCAAARLSACAWAAPGALLARGCAHAAYALALAAPAPPADLLHERHHFTEQEVMTSVWICVLCRCARAGAGGAGALLAKWAEPPRLALLRAVLPGAAGPTPRHRLLCRLALCIITPGSEPLIRAYEAACPAVAGSTPGAAWARAPSPKHLPMLAMLIYPGHDNYFTEEIKMAASGN